MYFIISIIKDAVVHSIPEQLVLLTKSKTDQSVTPNGV